MNAFYPIPYPWAKVKSCPYCSLYNIFLENVFEIKRHVTAVCSSKVCISRNGLLLQLWTSLFYQGWLNSILGRTVIQWVWVNYRNFCFRPILQSLLTYNCKLTSENCVTISLTLKEGCSLSKASKVTALQKVKCSSFFSRLFFHNPSTYWCIWR